MALLDGMALRLLPLGASKPGEARSWTLDATASDDGTFRLFLPYDGGARGALSVTLGLHPLAEGGTRVTVGRANAKGGLGPPFVVWNP